jgi:hypothetical protein
MMKHEENIDRLLKERATLSIADGEHRERLRSQLLDEMRMRTMRMPSKERWAGVRTWAWTMTAAALLIFALAQTRFTLSIGNTELRWGKGLQDKEMRTSLENLHYQMDAGFQMADLNRRQIRTLQLKDQQLSESFVQMTSWLARQQQLETETRLQDLKRLIQLTGIEDARVSERSPMQTNNIGPTKNHETP